MILKGSQRGGGQNLAVHLMRTDDNEHVRVHEIRGFASDDLAGAFKEAEAISRATRCKQYLFSLSLNPPERERVDIDAFEATIGRAEKALGLEGQPRVIVFHEKEGRRHAHCVWSRIDADTMTAKQLSFYKTRLADLSRELYLEKGWEMPRGLIDAGKRNPLNFTLAEWQRAKRQGDDPRWLKAIVQDCWKRTDGAAAFAHALDERCMSVARGDSRTVVVLDHRGEVHALSRLLGLKAKDVRGRFSDGNALPTVSETRAALTEKMTPALRAHIEVSRAKFQQGKIVLDVQKQTLTAVHRDERRALDQKLRQEWDVETRQRAARLPKGLLGLRHRITGQYAKVRRENESEAKQTLVRHAAQKQQLADKQLDQRIRLQSKIKELRNAQATELRNLRRDLSHYRWLKFADPTTQRQPTTYKERSWER